jgi:membrane protein YqaA with SNARE-associated domain
LILSTASLIARPAFVAAFLRWLHRLGGPGLIILGLLDNSVLPIPGSMDVATIIFCAQEKKWWPYYVAMATAGSVLGGYTTYRLARGEGKGRLGSRLSRRNMNRVKQAFEKWGIGSIVVPALLPPPMPMVPFIMAAGATQYSVRKFLTALAIARAVRYTILGLLGVLYGRWIIVLIRSHTRSIVIVGIAILAASVCVVLARWKLQPATAHR